MKIFSRVLVALALVVGATLVAPAPAVHANDDPRLSRLICFEVDRGTIRLVPCFDLGRFPERERPLPIPVGCPECQPYVHLFLSINPLSKIQFFEQFAVGLRLLGDAELATDSQLREQLRYQASQTMLSAVRVIGSAPVYLAQFGYVDPDTYQVYQHQSMYPVAINLQQGIVLLQSAAQGGAAGPTLSAAMSRFQDALRAFATL